MSNEAPKNNWDNKELGVLWKRESKAKGEKFLTGVINLKNVGLPDKDVSVIIFSNKNKKKDNHPDLRIYVSEERNGGTTTTATRATRTAPAATTAPVAATAPAQDNELI
jgi:pseudouridine-5'-phosphate glycosidase